MDDIGDQLGPEVVAGVKELIEEYKARPEPQTIDDLIEMNAETGTHSIIDMHGIGEEPDIGILSPMPEDLMMEILGTLQPDRSNVESQMDELSCGIKACHYFIVYEGDSPSEICFIGYSGD